MKTPQAEATLERVWVTQTRSDLGRGRLLGADNGMWLYRAVPLAPVLDASSPSKRDDAAKVILDAFEELSKATRVTVARRAAARSEYRDVQLLLVNVPQRYRPPAGSAHADWLRDTYGQTVVDHRVLLFGVRLRDRIIRRGASLKKKVSSAVESVVETLTSGMVPLEDFAEDLKAVDAMLARSGMREPTEDEMLTAAGWWNSGRRPDMPWLLHADHVHFFTTVSGARTAAALEKTVDHDQIIADGGRPPCLDWRLPDEFPVTFANVTKVNVQGADSTEDWALWVSDLLLADARMVSIRGRVEPPRVTRKELERRRDQYRSDIEDRTASGRMSKAEQEQALVSLGQMEAQYAVGGGYPTLTDTSVIVAFEGVRDVEDILQNSPVELSSTFSQAGSLLESMLCSPIRVNPHRLDLPAPTIASSGIVSLSTVGDPDGALGGFSEVDRQPSYVSSDCVSEKDALPFMVLLGGTGSGKSLTALHLANQWARRRTPLGEFTPIGIVDPKLKSDFTAGVRASDGQVASLDDNADGILDPIRLIDVAEAVPMAAAMLSSITATSRSPIDEIAAIKALHVGLAHGARCTGQALRIAAEVDPSLRPMVDMLIDLADGMPLFRALFGINPSAQALSVAQGITLIKAGGTDLMISPGEERSVFRQVKQWAVRMMVYGMAAALAGRYGVLILDEAWMFMLGDSGPAEMQRLGRLARSWKVLPVLASQRVREFLDAELRGYISRGFILSLEEDEAHAAFELFKQDATRSMIDRISASQFKEGSESPNWASYKALRDPVTNKVLRGSIAQYIDLSRRSVPIEVSIPPDFLRLISTRASDERARAQEAVAA